MVVGVRIVTWNVQGLAGVDTGIVRRTLAPLAVDVLALEEVQPRQARAVARSLGMRHRWVFKHWPFPHRREGLAVLTAHDIVGVTAFVLRRAVPWSWRRRVALRATIGLGAGRVDVVAAHLSPHGDHVGRAREVERVLAEVTAHPGAIVGDLNDLPDGPTRGSFLAAGWRDAWSECHGDTTGGATNWTPGSRTGRPPTQRLDYVLVPPGWTVESCDVVDTPLADLAAVSDHLPLLADLRAVVSP